MRLQLYLHQVPSIDSYWWIFIIGSLPLTLPLCPVSLLFASCTILLNPLIQGCSNDKFYNRTIVAMCPQPHIFPLPILFCWTELSVLLLLEADVPLDSSNNQYSQQSLSIHAPSTFLACCWSGRAMQQGTSVTLETSSCHMNSFRRTSF